MRITLQELNILIAITALGHNFRANSGMLESFRSQIVAERALYLNYFALCFQMFYYLFKSIELTFIRACWKWAT
jgi:hypothetical protein